MVPTLEATVGLDVTPLAAPTTGIGRYAYELLAALWRIGQEQRVMALGNRTLAAPRLPYRSGADAAAVIGPRIPSRAAWTFGVLPWWLPSAGFGVFHGTSYYAPLAGKVPTVVTFHDMSVFACPQHHPRARVLRARALLGRVARHASAIIAPSNFSANEITRWLDLSPERIRVVPAAGAPSFAECPADAAISDAARRYALEPGFFLSLGTVEPRKNLGHVVEAVARLRRDGEPATLVVAGRLGWSFEPILEQVRRHRLGGAVRFLGYVPDDDLRSLMALATALVYPSLYEGFGLPVVEAMSAGLPVITSRSGALQEVASTAALLVDPLDPLEIASAMAVVAQDDGLRARLRTEGRRRAADFSWERSAWETMAVYRDVLAGRGATT